MNKLYQVVTLIKRTCTIVCVVTLCLAYDAAAQVQLVADIDPLKYETGTEWTTKDYTLHVSGGTRSFFVGRGTEFWTSDGTTDGTRILKRFLNISATIAVNGTCYFAAQTDAMGVELWKSDGTAAGTVLVKDIFPGKGNSTPTDLVKIGSTVYFSANNNANGRELWKTDGTLAGTQLVADINPGAASSGPNKLAVLNSQVFFSADNGVNGRELWSSNGTAGGTALLKDIYTGATESTPQDLVSANGLLFFTAVTAVDGRQLWTSDGTSAGTNLLTIIKPGGTHMGRLTPANNLVFFEAQDVAHGLELWRSDGTAIGTFLAKDITPGPGSEISYGEKHLDSFNAVNGKLFFKAVVAGASRLWMSDGTPAGTVQLPVAGEVPIPTWMDVKFREFNGDAYFVAMGDFDHAHLFKSDMSGTVTRIRQDVSFTFAINPQFAVMNGLLFFLSRDHLWKSDGTTAGTVRVKQTGIPAGSNPTQLHDLNGTLIFNTEGPNGLWRTEGSAASTSNFSTATSITYSGAAANNVLFFSGPAPSSTTNVAWRTDGTSAGTFPVSLTGQYPYRFAAANGLIFFNASTSAQGEELWRSDGTTSGTYMTKDINPGSGGIFPRTLLGTSSQVFLPIYTAAVGNELWRSDGSFAGTVLVKDIYPGSQSSNIEALVNYNERAYFFANDGVNGLEFWTSDGTSAGTFMVKDVQSGDATTDDMLSTAAANNFVLFSAIEAGNKTIWSSDGTTANTFRIANFSSGVGDPIFIGNAGDDAMFMLPVGTNTELWRTDGTAAGTVRIHTFTNQISGAANAAVGNILYFVTANYANQYRTLWRTDGTIAGTYEIQFDGSVGSLMASGPYVYFNGSSHKYGNELFFVDEGLSGARESAQARAQLAEEVLTTGLSHYPNPFQSDLTISLKGNDGERFDLQVLNTSGAKVFERNGLACNTTHTFKPEWQNGMYIMRIQHYNRVITKKVVKVQE
jgi:ELWxxDGT repeat protein